MIIPNLYYGWDVSSSAIGCCCQREDGSVVLIRAVRLDKIEGGITAKYQTAANGMRRFIADCRDTVGLLMVPGRTNETHFIEQRLKNMVGKTNKDTLLALAAFNGMATYVIIDECGGDHMRVQHLYPAETKRAVGVFASREEKEADVHIVKKKSIAYVMERYKEFPYTLNRGGVNPEKGVDDMADAFITVDAGRQLTTGALTRKKTKPAKKVAGKTSDRKEGKKRGGVQLPVVFTSEAKALGKPRD